MPKEQKYVLGLAHQAGKDPRIAMGADGSRDYFSPEELEKAAWAFASKGNMQIGLQHLDGTAGIAKVVESYIWRGEPWVLNAEEHGKEVIVRKGDWLIGAILSDEAWDMVKKGQITGFSVQGAARRINNN
jgi:hypothetical protein